MIKITMLDGKPVTEYTEPTDTVDNALHDIEANGFSWLEMTHHHNGDITITIYK